MAEYQFILQAGAQLRLAYPIWKKDLSKEYAYEQNQMFMRAKLTGNLIFQRNDYDFIMAQSIETKIYLTIKVDYNHSGIFTDYWRGSFHLTDCTINVDDKMVTVKPEVEDRYNKILAGLDKEFDLVTLKPAAQEVDYFRRPMLQIYVLGESYVNCYVGGMHWEQEIDSSDHYETELIQDFYFGIVGKYYEIYFDTPPAGLTTPMVGFAEHANFTGEWSDFGNEDGMYRMTYFCYATQTPVGTLFTNGLRIKGIDNDLTYWEFSQERINEPLGIPDRFVMESTLEGVDNLTGNTILFDVLGRMLYGKSFGDGFYPVPANDIVLNNRNYRYVSPFSGGLEMRSTTRYSTQPTDYGRRPDGTYYLPPVLSIDEIQSGTIDAIYPLGRSNWESTSLWLLYTVALDQRDSNYKTPTTLRDAYPIEGAISALLKEIDPSLSFAATTDYSVFLYGSNPLTNDWGRLAITPKSNITVAQYSQPAQQAPIKLSEILNVLKQAMGCYWFIDDNGKFRIEHISWFKNGGAYSGTPAVGIDITELYNSRNRQKWSLGTAQYQYDKLQMPERYEFSWADDTTEEFKGKAIVVRSTFVQEGNIEEVNIAKFNSDIDYILLNPSAVSQDGFALMCCQVVSGKWSLKMKQFDLVGDDTLPYKAVTLQNYQLAMISLQPNFLISDMSARYIVVNGENTLAKGIQRKKQQEINIPMPDGDGELQKLIGTTIGNGEIYRMTLNLDSRMAKIQLRYDTV